MSETVNESSNVEIKENVKRPFVFSRGMLCIPYAVFLLFFVVFPFFLIVFYAFTSRDGSFSLQNFKWFFTELSNIRVLLKSFLIGGLTTVFCLLLGYPVAYVLSRMKASKRTMFLLLFIMPMWINFVLRAMAMKELLSILGMLGKYNLLNTIIGMVYDYLPFMVLSIYTVLIKIDKCYEEAAADLGADKVKVFFSITLPLSVAGIISGITMVFLPSMTCYVISDTYGSGKITIIGKLIEMWFGSGSNWNYGSVVALILLGLMMLTSLISFGKSDSESSVGAIL